MRTYLDAASADAAFRFPVLGPEDISWASVEPAKHDFATIAERVIAAAVAAGHLRADVTFDDFVLVTRGILANMDSADGFDWRRHLALTLAGLRRAG